MLLAVAPFLASIIACDADTKKSHKHEEKTQSGYFVQGDFIFWQATMDGLEYTVDVKPTSQGFPSKQSWKEPTPEWTPGVRLKVGKELQTKGWEVSLAWTHLINHSNHHTHQKGSHFLEQLWIPSEFGMNPLSAAAHWALNYNTIDLLLKHPIEVSRHFCASPFFGLRGAWIHQKLHVIYKGGDFSTTDPIKLHAYNNFGGVGIHLGTNLDYLFNPRWNLFGRGAFTLYYSRFSVLEKVKGENVIIDFSSNDLFHEHSSFDRITSDVSAALGVKWEPKISGWDHHLSLSLAYEFTYLFNQNQMRQYRNIDPQGRQRGNLGLQGATLSLAIKL